MPSASRRLHLADLHTLGRALLSSCGCCVCLKLRGCLTSAILKNWNYSPANLRESTLVLDKPMSNPPGFSVDQTGLWSGVDITYWGVTPIWSTGTPSCWPQLPGPDPSSKETRNNHTAIPQNSQHEFQTVVHETCFVRCCKKELTCQKKTCHAQQVPRITSFVVVFLACLGHPSFFGEDEWECLKIRHPPNKNTVNHQVLPWIRFFVGYDPLSSDKAKYHMVSSFCPISRCIPFFASASHSNQPLLVPLIFPSHSNQAL